MATQRRYSIEFKRQVVQEYQAGGWPPLWANGR